MRQGHGNLDEYAGRVADAAAGRPGLVIVGQSYGAFTATLAASRLPVRLLVLLAGMIPSRREPGPVVDQHRIPAGRPGAGQDRRRQDRPRRPAHHFLQRVRLAGRGGPAQAGAGILRGLGHALATGCVPDVPTKLILCQDDQFFPAAFMRRVARERLGMVPDEVPGCHCARSATQGANRPSRELPRLTADPGHRGRATPIAIAEPGLAGSSVRCCRLLPDSVGRGPPVAAVGRLVEGEVTLA